MGEEEALASLLAGHFPDTTRSILYMHQYLLVRQVFVTHFVDQLFSQTIDFKVTEAATVARRSEDAEIASCNAIKEMLSYM